MAGQIERRSLLVCVGASVGMFLAGCTEPARSPWRELSFRDMKTEEKNDEWRVSFELVKLAQGPDGVEVFHDVRVHAYDRNQTEVGTKALGTISESYPGGDGLPVEMTCTAFPTMITYSAAESPCDEEVVTIISIAVYDEEQGWLLELNQRECGEGLPPEPRKNSDST